MTNWFKNLYAKMLPTFFAAIFHFYFSVRNNSITNTWKKSKGKSLMGSIFHNDLIMINSNKFSYL